MQMRFDGTLGFVGGLTDKKDESIVTGLNRELEEEINLDLTKHLIAQTDHLVTHVDVASKFVTHFYILKVNEAEYLEIEKRVFDAKEWGEEVCQGFN